jgi:hypothetical protein
MRMEGTTNDLEGVWILVCSELMTRRHGRFLTGNGRLQLALARLAGCQPLTRPSLTFRPASLRAHMRHLAIVLW